MMIVFIAFALYYFSSSSLTLKSSNQKVTLFLSTLPLSLYSPSYQNFVPILIPHDRWAKIFSIRSSIMMSTNSMSTFSQVTTHLLSSGFLICVTRFVVTFIKRKVTSIIVLATSLIRLSSLPGSSLALIIKRISERDKKWER